MYGRLRCIVERIAFEEFSKPWIVLKLSRTDSSLYQTTASLQNFDSHHHGVVLK